MRALRMRGGTTPDARVLSVVEVEEVGRVVAGRRRGDTGRRVVENEEGAVGGGL